MSTAPAPDGLLRTALRANAAFSGASGAALLAVSGWLSPELGLENRWMLPVLGFGLVGFAALLVQVTGDGGVDLRAATAISLADGGWVAGSAALVWLDPTGMTDLGRWLVLGVADVVLLFGLAQAWGIWRTRRHAGHTS